jgi:hypothetical protein
MELPPRVAPREGAEKLTANGIERARLDPALFREILQQHRAGSGRQEHVPGDFVTAGKGRLASRINDLPNTLRTRIHLAMRPMLEEWVGRPLIPTYVYGIRTYLRNATLAPHRDKDVTHIVSAILNVAQKVDEPWALQMEPEADQKEDWRECFMEPGDLLFYESNRLMHARMKPLNGDAYSGVFVHFKLA